MERTSPRQQYSVPLCCSRIQSRHIDSKNYCRTLSKMNYLTLSFPFDAPKPSHRLLGSLESISLGMHTNHMVPRCPSTSYSMYALRSITQELLLCARTVETAREIDKEKYEVTVISPRNHFLFTPLLPSTTVGTLEFRWFLGISGKLPPIMFSLFLLRSNSVRVVSAWPCDT